jgi:hypothetical protein
LYELEPVVSSSLLAQEIRAFACADESEFHTGDTGVFLDELLRLVCLDHLLAVVVSNRNHASPS